MRDTLPEWSLTPLVQALMTMRGVQLVAAMTLVGWWPSCWTSLASSRRASSLPSHEAIPILSVHVTHRLLAASSRLVLKPTGLKRNDMSGNHVLRIARAGRGAWVADASHRRVRRLGYCQMF